MNSIVVPDDFPSVVSGTDIEEKLNAIGETKIFLNAILDLQIPFTTATVILPVPINPSFIIKPTIHKE